jgi:hypothetical protein
VTVAQQLPDQLVLDVAVEHDRDPVLLVEVIPGRDLVRELLPERTALLRVALQRDGERPLPLVLNTLVSSPKGNVRVAWGRLKQNSTRSSGVMATILAARPAGRNVIQAHGWSSIGVRIPSAEA